MKTLHIAEFAYDWNMYLVHHANLYYTGQISSDALAQVIKQYAEYNYQYSLISMLKLQKCIDNLKQDDTQFVRDETELLLQSVAIEAERTLF